MQAREVRYLVFWSNDVVEEAEARPINVFIREEVVLRILPQLFGCSHLLWRLKSRAVRRCRSWVDRDGEGDIFDHGVHVQVHS
jgi:hypothetical protein